MSIRMIVTDLDNTLLRSDKSISAYTGEIFRQIKRRGILVAFATARAERLTRKYQDVAEPDIVIADNGAIVLQGNAVLMRFPIQNDATNRLIGLLMKHEAVKCLTVETGHCLYTDYDGPPWEQGWGVWNRVLTDFAEPINEEVTKISIECIDVDLLREILRDFPDLHLYYNSGEAWNQVMRREATKMNAIEFVARERGIDLSDIVAFGDDINDVGMLSGCGMGVAVNNAITSAKAAAMETCPSNDEDGVAKWLERNVL